MKLSCLFGTTPGSTKAGVPPPEATDTGDVMDMLRGFIGVGVDGGSLGDRG